MFDSENEMLTYLRTSILTSPAQTVVNTVNCVGVMGKGIAAEYKRRFPDMFSEYKRICDEGLLEPGKLWLWQGSDQWVLNFPTKKHWRNPSRLEWIEMGLEKFVQNYQARGITEIAFPRLGCGNGGLEWSDVKPLMEGYLSGLPIPVFIHDFEVSIGLPEHLEKLVEQVRSTLSGDRIGAFESFSRTLSQVLEQVGNDLIDFDGNLHFSASINECRGMTLQFKNYDFDLDEESIRNIWTALQNSLVTTGHIREIAGEAASSVFSVLTLVPNIKLVQIQQRNKDAPEVALQIDRRRVEAVDARDSGDQLALTWR